MSLGFVEIKKSPQILGWILVSFDDQILKLNSGAGVLIMHKWIFHDPYAEQSLRVERSTMVDEDA